MLRYLSITPLFIKLAVTKVVLSVFQEFLRQSFLNSVMVFQQKLGGRGT